MIQIIFNMWNLYQQVVCHEKQLAAQFVFLITAVFMFNSHTWKIIFFFWNTKYISHKLHVHTHISIKMVLFSGWARIQRIVLNVLIHHLNVFPHLHSNKQFSKVFKGLRIRTNKKFIFFKFVFLNENLWFYNS